MALLSACAACASAPGGESVGGVATYDNLKTARTACEAKGEKLALKSQGDPQRMAAYECKRN
ncbi:hypothetical protein [Phenylobacterium aquaticum]|uniref:hypothetical protein n=1 Tax=Phenylobacterium aquaticum TaxID=1763816 RepID=UPI0026EF826F|nr:hypothetical protein [Phenylobacterium aquaticum]